MHAHKIITLKVTTVLAYTSILDRSCEPNVAAAHQRPSGG